eukprot:gene36464-39713_t
MDPSASILVGQPPYRFVTLFFAPDGAEICDVPVGETLRVTGGDDKWIRVCWEVPGMDGFVRRRVISPPRRVDLCASLCDGDGDGAPPPPTPSRRSSADDDARDDAREPYVVHYSPRAARGPAQVPPPPPPSPGVPLNGTGPTPCMMAATASTPPCTSCSSTAAVPPAVDGAATHHHHDDDGSPVAPLPG